MLNIHAQQIAKETVDLEIKFDNNYDPLIKNLYDLISDKAFNHLIRLDLYNNKLLIHNVELKAPVIPS